MIELEYRVYCRLCGTLGERLDARGSESLAAKHVKDTGHPVVQSGIPVPPNR